MFFQESIWREQKQRKFSSCKIVTLSITRLVTLRYRQSFQNSVWSCMPNALYNTQRVVLQLMEKRNVKQSRLSVCVFILEKKNCITEIKWFVTWHYHGQIMLLWFLFIIFCICGSPLETESWRASFIHLSGLELTCILNNHSYFKCSLIKILLLIYSLKTEPELI